jgi:hypothetical protein
MVFSRWYVSQCSRPSANSNANIVFIHAITETTGVHFLFAPIYLDSPWKLLIAYAIIIIICWAERFLTYKLDTIGYEPYGNRIGTIIVRTLYYGVATVLRLLYMLVAMYFNTGLFLVLVCQNVKLNGPVK